MSDNEKALVAEDQASVLQQVIAQYEALDGLQKELVTFKVGVKPMVLTPENRSQSTPQHIQQLKKFHGQLSGWTPPQDPHPCISQWLVQLEECVTHCLQFIEKLCEYLELSHSFLGFQAKVNSGAMDTLRQKFLELKHGHEYLCSMLKEERILALDAQEELHFQKALPVELARSFAVSEVGYERLRLENEELKEGQKVASNAINTLSPEYQDLAAHLQRVTHKYSLRQKQDRLQTCATEEAKWEHKRQVAVTQLRLARMQKHAMVGIVGAATSKKEQEEEQKRRLASLDAQVRQLEAEKKLIRGNLEYPAVQGAQQPPCIEYSLGRPKVTEVDDEDNDPSPWKLDGEPEYPLLAAPNTTGFTCLPAKKDDSDFAGFLAQKAGNDNGLRW